MLNRNICQFIDMERSPGVVVPCTAHLSSTANYQRADNHASFIFFVISRNYKQFITIVLLTQEPRMTSQKSALPIALLYQTFGHLAVTGILVYLCVMQKLQNKSS